MPVGGASASSRRGGQTAVVCGSVPSAPSRPCWVFAARTPHLPIWAVQIPEPQPWDLAIQLTLCLTADGGAKLTISAWALMCQPQALAAVSAPALWQFRMKAMTRRAMPSVHPEDIDGYGQNFDSVHSLCVKVLSQQRLDNRYRLRGEKHCFTIAPGNSGSF